MNKEVILMKIRLLGREQIKLQEQMKYLYKELRRTHANRKSTR